MSLIVYNNESGLLPSGFINLGATCYFNALLQSILSCTSFIDIIFNEREIFNNNSITRLIVNYIEDNKEYERLSHKGNSETKLNILKNKLNNFAPVIWKEMIALLCKKKEHTSTIIYARTTMCWRRVLLFTRVNGNVPYYSEIISS